MLSASSVYELKRMGIGLLICSAISAVIFSIVLGYQNSILFGTLLGFSAAFLNYFFLAVYIERSVKKKKNAALSAMGFIALMIYFAIKSEFINQWAMIVPLIFPRIIIMCLSYADTHKKEAQKVER